MYEAGPGPGARGRLPAARRWVGEWVGEVGGVALGWTVFVSEGASPASGRPAL